MALLRNSFVAGVAIASRSGKKELVGVKHSGGKFGNEAESFLSECACPTSRQFGWGRSLNYCAIWEDGIKYSRTTFRKLSQMPMPTKRSSRLLDFS